MSKSYDPGILFKNKRRYIFVIIYFALGITTVLSSILLYPFSLPKIITDENSNLLQQGVYIFYAKLFFGLILVVMGLRKLGHQRNSTKDANLFSPSPIWQQPSLSKVITEILKNARYFRYFWPASISYWLFYGFISSMVIYRSVNLSDLYGVSIPSISMITYGPIGYVPTVAAYLTNHLGLLVTPINLIISIVVSALVGLNMVLSIYAFKLNQSTRLYKKGGLDNRGRSAAALGVLGGTTGLFTACPTCASFYIFNLMAGAMAPTIAAFAVAYYMMFVVLSIPLLFLTLFISASSIRKKASSQCFTSKNSNNGIKSGNK
jgi:hypothetical protein